MVDAQKQPVSRAVPLRLAFPLRKLQNLQRVTVWVFEVEGLDAAGVGVPVRQALGTGGSVLDLVLAQPLIGAVHVTNDNRNMLKPAIIAARVHWDRSALGRQIFGQ